MSKIEANMTIYTRQIIDYEMRAKDWGRKDLYELTIKSRESIKPKRNPMCTAIVTNEIHGWI